MESSERGIEVSVKIVVQGFFIPIASLEKVGIDFSFLAERFEDLGGLAATDDGDAIDKTPLDGVGIGFAALGPHENLGAIELAEPFETTREIHAIADRGVGKTLLGTQVSKKNVGGVDPDARAELELALCFPLGIAKSQRLEDLEGRVDRITLVLGVLLGSIEKGEGAVPGEAARDAAIFLLTFRHDLEEFTELGKGFVGSELFTETGKPGEVGEDHGHFAKAASELGLVPPGEEEADEVPRDIAGKGPEADLHLSDRVGKEGDLSNS